MQVNQRFADLALLGFFTLAASAVLAAGEPIDTPYPDGGLEPSCDGVYIDDPVGETCYTADGTTIYCPWGSPYCVTTPPRPVGVDTGTFVARPPVGGNTLAPAANPPAIPGSLSSPNSTDTLGQPSCQTDPTCG